MRFSTQIAATALLVASTTLSTPILQARAMNPNDVAANIQKITALSQTLQTKAASIGSGTLLLNPADIQPLVTDFQEIITTVQNDITAMGASGSSTPPYTDVDQQSICDAFHSFVTTQQNLLSTVIGKSGLVQGILGAPVAATLRSLEAVVDTFAFGIIDSVPSCAAGATTDLNNLDGTLKQAICAYTPLGSIGSQILC